MSELDRTTGAAAPPAPAPVPPELQQFYTRADAARADLTTWGQQKAKSVGLTWGARAPRAEIGGA